MASKYLQKFPVPPGFQQILADFTKEVLRDQPESIAEYAAKYFEMMQKGQKFQFNSKYNVRKEDKKNQLSHNPKKAEQITKKAAGISASIGSSAQAQPREKIVQQKHEQQQESMDKSQNQQHPEQQPHERQQVSDQEQIREKELVHQLQQVKNDVAQKEVKKFLDQLSLKIQQKARNQGQTRISKVRSLVDSVFPDFDKDGSGFLDDKQLPLFTKAVLTALTFNADQEVDEQTVKTFKNMCDSNRDGKISKKELQNFLRFHIGDLI